ncbi:NUDIX hydrolase [Guptibacillus algicola]|uniref:NUDIX hydrolase n=1 Tax=Guptibacillus algicola TaxID=225844 RepID=UPI001CD7BA43|nr:NUDIX domain-containing protein [Alkalihalobacillus algicola]MCA0987475.1 NUDIX domain-containing protein [Alkalihalobacillus algicola]
MRSIVVNWGESRVSLSWHASNTLPHRELITSVHGFCFKDGKFLLVKLNDRGWDFPGGHIEEGETPEECFQREAFEEGYVSGACTLLGSIVVDHRNNDQWDEWSPYPKVGYQVFYSMAITEVHPFEGNYESGERIFIDAKDVKMYYSKWNDVYQDILDGI